MAAACRCARRARVESGAGGVRAALVRRFWTTGSGEVFRARYASVADLSWLDQPAALIAATRAFSYQPWPAADDRR
jgi:hypothetical protein